MRNEIKTHKMKVLGRRVVVTTEVYPNRTPPQTTYSIEGTLRGHPVEEMEGGGVFVGTKNGSFLEKMEEELKDRIINPQNWQAKKGTVG